MREAHGEGSFAGILCEPSGCFLFRHQQHEAREIFRMVLNPFGENRSAIVLGRVAPGNGGARFVPTGHDFADAARGVFRGNTFPLRMRGKKAFALRQGHRMRSHGADVVQRSSGERNELHFDRQNGFRNHGESVFQKQIEHAHHGTREGIFHRSENRIGRSLSDGTKDGLKAGMRHGLDGFAKELHRSGFAESAGLSLESDAQRFAIGRGHGHALSCNKRRKTESCRRRGSKR